MNLNHFPLLEVFIKSSRQKKKHSMVVFHPFIFSYIKGNNVEYPLNSLITTFDHCGILPTIVP